MGILLSLRLRMLSILLLLLVTQTSCTAATLLESRQYRGRSDDDEYDDDDDGHYSSLDSYSASSTRTQGYGTMSYQTVPTGTSSMTIQTSGTRTYSSSTTSATNTRATNTDVAISGGMTALDLEPEPEHPKSKALSTGGIIGIAVGLPIAAGLVVLFFLLRRSRLRRKRKHAQRTSFLAAVATITDSEASESVSMAESGFTSHIVAPGPAAASDNHLHSNHNLPANSPYGDGQAHDSADRLAFPLPPQQSWTSLSSISRRTTAGGSNLVVVNPEVLLPTAPLPSATRAELVAYQKSLEGDDGKSTQVSASRPVETDDPPPNYSN